MGIYQKYIKKDKHGNPVSGKDGKPKKTGPWFIQYPYARDPATGKIKYKTEKASFQKSKAEKMFREKADRFQEMESFGVQVDTEKTFSEFIDWGLEQEVMKAKVSASDDIARGRYLKAAFGNIKAVQVTPLMVDNFRLEMVKTKSEHTKKPFSGTTVNKIITLGRRIYYLGMDAGLVKRNPFARRGVFKEEGRGKYVSDAEFKKLCEKLPDYLKPAVITAYFTGMRRGEILMLTWDRVDLFRGLIDLTPDDTKTGEPRHIYFNTILELKNIFVEAAKRKSSKQKFVFIRPDGQPVHKRYTERAVKKACSDADIEPYRFHDLRHTFNTNMIKAGVPQTVIMKLTGHKTNHMFTRYSHVDKELGEDAMVKLKSFLKGKTDTQGDGHEQEKQGYKK